MEKYTEMLKEKKISPSVQRLKILEYLDINRVHPTVEEIFAAIREEIPILSKMTVYNTLKLFAANGLVKSIPTSDNKGHYDYNTSPHTHFKCRQCKRVFDIDVDYDLHLKSGLEGLKVLEHNLIFEGICQDCRRDG
ncbi:MAG: transcriptional repressor [Candidatus Cloacimonetes bacterium]|nr:transcriptional repressor [Candidatus Cloacimonadota bacterium]